MNVRHQSSLYSSLVFIRFFIQRHLLLPRSPQSGAYVGNAPLSFKKQFNPNQRSSRRLFVSKNALRLNHQIINRQSKEKVAGDKDLLVDYRD